MGEAVVARERPLRVALTLRWFYPHITGEVTRQREYGRRLRDYGITYEIDTALTPESREAEPEVDGIPVFRHEVTRAGRKISGSEMDAAILRAAIARWEKSRQLPDIIILFGASRLLLPGVLWARRKGIPCVFVCSIAPDPITNKLAALKAKLVSMLMFGLFKEVIVHTGTLRDDYFRMGAPLERMHVIPFGVDCERFRPAHTLEEKDALRLKLGLPLNVPVAVFVGSVVERKGADLLIQAWREVSRQLPHAILVLAGPFGPRETLLDPEERARHEQFLREFEEEKKHLLHPESLLMPGAVSNPEEYLRAADVFIFPSRVEGLPGAVLEAMASGLPCLMTRFSGYPEEELGRAGVHHQLTGFEVNEIADSLLAMLQDCGERLRLGAAARDWALRELDMKIIVGRIAKVLHRAVNRP